MANILNEVTEILKKYAINKDVWQNFSPKSHIINDLKINSARIVDIILDVEDKYAININDRALEKINTVEDIVVLINSLKNEH